MSKYIQTLNDVCEFINDCLHNTAPTQEDGYPLIRTPNVGTGKLLLDGVQRVSEETYKEWTRRSVPIKDDLIMAREAPAGNVGIVTDGMKVCLGQRTVHLRPNKKKVYPSYLNFYLSDPHQKARLLANETGATSKHVNLADIRKFPLPEFPPLPVQKKIADILSAYDDLIEVNRRSIQLLEESARRLYKEWFVHFRFPNHEKVKMVDGLPVGWKRVPFNTVVQINPTERVANTDEIRSFPMSSLSTSQMTIEMSEVEIREKPTGVKFRNGDTLVARITPCLQNGKTGFVQCLHESEVACGSTEFIVLRSKDLCPEMVYCIARTDDFRDKAIQSMVGASGRQRVQDECFGKIFIHLPSKVVLENFEMLTRPIWEKIRILDHEIIDAMIARDRILPRLMSGKVVID